MIQRRPSSLDVLLSDVRACRVCEPYLPLGPRPVVRANRDARILIRGSHRKSCRCCAKVLNTLLHTLRSTPASQEST